LGYLEPHKFVQLTPELVSRARDLWPERSIDEFELLDTGAKTVFIDRESGEQFVPEESALLTVPPADPHASGVVCFCVDRNGRMNLLRPRGVPQAPTSSRPIATGVTWGRIDKLNVKPARTSGWRP
jgi:hypothetical protein